MIYRILFYIFFLTYSSTSLFAKEKEFCRSVKNLKNQVIICIDNTAFLNAAKTCYKKFETLSKKIAQEKEGAYLPKKKQQSTYFNKTTSFLNINKNKLVFLKETNEKIQDELDAYLSSLIKPVDDRTLSKTKCYADSYNEIQSTLTKLRDDHKKTLSALKQISLDKSKTNSSENNLNSSTKTILMDKPQDLQALPNKKNQKNQNESDISGTEEIKSP